MGEFETMSDGQLDDRPRIVFGGQVTRIFESYTVTMSVLQQPAAFSVTVGDGDTVKGILAAIPPNTPFQFKIGGYTQFTGFTGGPSASGSASSGTSVVLRGRDVLAKLHDSDVDKEMAFVDITYAEMVIAALKEVGLGHLEVVHSNADSQKIRTGVNVFTTKTGETSPTGAAIFRHKITAQLGESWLAFVTRHLEKAGLMIWADALGRIVIGSPEKDQPPIYRFARQRGQAKNVVNVTDFSYRNDTDKRYSKITVYARNGGRRSGRGHIHGSYVDEEMVAYGIHRLKTYRDMNVADEQQAVKYARHKMAEFNRAAWNLSYTCSGHTAPSLSGHGRGILAPDTNAIVEDDELGISGIHYLESVAYSGGGSGRTTLVTLMRPRDLVFEPDPTIAEQITRAKKGK